MKFWLTFLLICFLASVPIYSVQATQTAPEEEGRVGLDRYLEDLGLEDLSIHWEQLQREYGNYLPESKRGTIMELAKMDNSSSFQDWLTGIIRFFVQEITLNFKLMGSLMLLTIFSVFLQSLHSAFEKGAVSKVAYSVIFMVLIMLALNSFRMASEYAIEAIDRMSHFIMALLPLLLALIASSGGVVSAGFLHPAIVFLVNVSSVIMKGVVLPLLFLSTLLTVANTLNGELKVTQLAGLLKKASIGILGAFIAILLTVISLRGAAAAVADGVAIKTAKFVTGNFVPVVGRMFTDAADTILSASVVLKNTVGLAGVIIVLLIAAFPAIKILVISFVYKLTAALLQPIGDGPVIACLNVVSNSMLYIFASLAIVSFMFFISITIIIASGNLTMMIR